MGRFYTWLSPRKEESNGRIKEGIRLVGIRDVKIENIKQT